MRITTPLATIIVAIVAAVSSIFSAYISQQAKEESEKNLQEISIISVSISEIKTSITNFNNHTNDIKKNISDIKKDISDIKIFINSSSTKVEKPIDAVKSVEINTKTIIKKLLTGYSGVIRCNESESGNDIKLTLSGEADIYKENEYLVANSSTATYLATGIQNVISELNSIPKNVDFSVSGIIVGHADQLKIINTNIYNGHTFLNRCRISVNNGKHIIENITSGIILSDNRLLACARAFSMAEEIIKAGIPESTLILQGNAHTSGPVEGEYRGIDVTLILRNILQIDPNFSICSRS